MGPEPPAFPLAAGADPARGGKPAGRELLQGPRARQAEKLDPADRRVHARHLPRGSRPRPGRDLKPSPITSVRVGHAIDRPGGSPAVSRPRSSSDQTRMNPKDSY